VLIPQRLRCHRLNKSGGDPLLVHSPEETTTLSEPLYAAAETIMTKFDT